MNMAVKTKAKKKAAPKKKAAKKRAAPGMSDAAVKAKTGKTWAEWIAALDKAGAKAMSHKEITKLLSSRHKLADWWSQMVTVGYERAKGLRESTVLFRHVLKNGMIPILTGVVVVIPSLFLGSLLMESFFGIPGLGSYTIDAINSQDFAVVRAMVFLGSVLYIAGLILTDISYSYVDPRVRFE